MSTPLGRPRLKSEYRLGRHVGTNVPDEVFTVIEKAAALEGQSIAGWLRVRILDFLSMSLPAPPVPPLPNTRGKSDRRPRKAARHPAALLGERRDSKVDNEPKSEEEMARMRALIDEVI